MARAPTTGKTGRKTKLQSIASGVEPAGDGRKKTRKAQANPTAESKSEPVVAEVLPPVEAEETGSKRKGKPKKDAAPEKADKKEEAKKKDKKKKKKEAVVIRFERDQLGQIDERAAALGLTRGAWVRMTVAQRLLSE